MIWVGTGGLHSRMIVSADDGLHWKAADVPVADGGELTGIFSIDFTDDERGIAAGGNYNDKSSTAQTVALTANRGNSWSLIDKENAPPFVSCVQYQPGSNRKILVAACLPGIYFSDDGGKHWKMLKDSANKIISDGWFTFRFSPSGKTAWFAGPGGRLARLQFSSC